MHDRVWSYIVSAAQTWTVGVTGATGYAGGEVCRLLAGHPNLRLAGVHANSSAGRRLGELQPHLLPYADMIVQPSDPASLAGYDVVVLALPHGESAAVAAAAPGRHPRRRLRRRPPAGRRRRVGALVRRRARRLLAVRAAGAARPAGEAGRAPRRIAVPGCYPTVGHPRAGPGARRRPDRARGGRRRRQRDERRRQVGQAAPARQRGDGLGERLRRRRGAPAHAGDDPEPRRRPPARR